MFFALWGPSTLACRICSSWNIVLFIFCLLPSPPDCWYFLHIPAQIRTWTITSEFAQQTSRFLCDMSTDSLIFLPLNGRISFSSLHINFVTHVWPIDCGRSDGLSIPWLGYQSTVTSYLSVLFCSLLDSYFRGSQNLPASQVISDCATFCVATLWEILNCNYPDKHSLNS